MKSARLLQLVLSMHVGLSVSLILAAPPDKLSLLPYPQDVEHQAGRLPLGPAEYAVAGSPSETEQVVASRWTAIFPATVSPCPCDWARSRKDTSHHGSCRRTASSWLTQAPARRLRY